MKSSKTSNEIIILSIFFKSIKKVMSIVNHFNLFNLIRISLNFLDVKYIIFILLGELLGIKKMFKFLFYSLVLICISVSMELESETFINSRLIYKKANNSVYYYPNVGVIP